MAGNVSLKQLAQTGAADREVAAWDDSNSKWDPAPKNTVKIVRKTANYTVVATDECIRVDPSSGNVTLNLYTNVADFVDGQILYIKRRDSSTNVVILDVGEESGATLDGLGGTFYLWHSNEALMLIWDDTNGDWMIF